MFFRYSILLIFLIFVESVYSQGIEKNNSKISWEIFGIGPSYTHLWTAFYPLQTQDFFRKMAQSDIAKQQYQLELDASKELNRHSFSDTYYPFMLGYSGYETTSNTYISSTDMVFLIKKRGAKPNWFFKNFAFKVGFGYIFNTNYYSLSGDSSNATHYYRYYSSSRLIYHVLKVNTGLQFQTPSIFNFLSLYVGIDGYLGGVADFQGSRDGALIKSEEKKAPYYDKLTQYDRGHMEFDKPILNLGISAPMGIGMRFSRKVTLNMGIVYSYNSYLTAKKLPGMKFVGGSFSLIITPDDYIRGL